MKAKLAIMALAMFAAIALWVVVFSPIISEALKTIIIYVLGYVCVYVVFVLREWTKDEERQVEHDWLKGRGE